MGGGAGDVPVLPHHGGRGRAAAPQAAPRAGRAESRACDGVLGRPELGATACTCWRPKALNPRAQIAVVELLRFRALWTREGDDPLPSGEWYDEPTHLLCTYEFLPAYRSRGRTTFLCAYVEGPGVRSSGWHLHIKLLVTLPGEEPCEDTAALGHLSHFLGFIDDDGNPEFDKMHARVDAFFVGAGDAHKELVLSWVTRAF